MPRVTDTLSSAGHGLRQESTFSGFQRVCPEHGEDRYAKNKGPWSELNRCRVVGSIINVNKQEKLSANLKLCYKFNFIKGKKQDKYLSKEDKKKAGQRSEDLKIDSKDSEKGELDRDHR
ncbi:Phospholipid Phosphatase 2 [Manis pentadactyla]|nr:Phospholipid Phosphatase 2 [Manis pentadactyla]